MIIKKVKCKSEKKRKRRRRKESDIENGRRLNKKGKD